MTRAKPIAGLIGAAVLLTLLATPTLAARSPLAVLGILPRHQEPAATCRDLDPSWRELDAVLAELGQPLAPGQVFSVNDGTLALLIVVVEASDQGGARAIDFAASVRISAIILRSGSTVEPRRFDPPVRNGSNLRSPGEGALDEVRFCYAISLPGPPPAGATTEPTAEATGTAPAPTPTALSFDLSGQQTAVAQATEVAATATAAAAEAATRIAETEARAAEVEATASAQADALASARAEAVAAQATVEALRATIAAPTPTLEPSPTATATLEPSPTATPAPTPTSVPERVVYATEGDAPFVDWQAPPTGWDLSGSVMSTTGEGPREWVVMPAAAGLGADYAVEIEFRVTGGEVCPRNFGVALRGSDAGYYAAGIEWACDPGVVLWAGAERIQQAALPRGTNLDDGWHTLRIGAVGNHLSVTIDDMVVIETTDERFPAGGVVALWSDRVALEIRSARIVEVGE